MYNFELTDYQKDIQMRARKFAQEEVLPGAIERDKTEVYDMELLKKLGDAGLIGLQFDPKYGGQAMIIWLSCWSSRNSAKLIPPSAFPTRSPLPLQPASIPSAAKSRRCTACPVSSRAMPSAALA